MTTNIKEKNVTKKNICISNKNIPVFSNITKSIIQNLILINIQKITIMIKSRVFKNEFTFNNNIIFNVL